MTRESDLPLPVNSILELRSVGNVRFRSERGESDAGSSAGRTTKHHRGTENSERIPAWEHGTDRPCGGNETLRPPSNTACVSVVCGPLRSLCLCGGISGLAHTSARWWSGRHRGLCLVSSSRLCPPAGLCTGSQCSCMIPRRPRLPLAGRRGRFTWGVVNPGRCSPVRRRGCR